MKPLVSVALATYNGELFLVDLLNSIYSQTYDNIEVIVTDDCSNDKTRQILQYYHDQYGLKYYINEQRLGHVKNFEKAISLTNGDYIALCDQDDMWLPDKIETLVNSVNGKQFICSDLLLINEKNNIISESLYKYKRLKFQKKEQFKYLLYTNFVIGCTILFHKSLKDYILPFPKNTLYHDWWIALVASSQNELLFLDKPLVKYRYHGENASSTGLKDNRIIDKIIDVQRKMQDNHYSSRFYWLKDLINYKAFSTLQKKDIYEALCFYNGITFKKIPLRATFIAIKNNRFILPRRNVVLRIIFAISILFLPLLRNVFLKRVTDTAPE